MEFDAKKIWEKIDPKIKLKWGRVKNVRNLEENGVAHPLNILMADVLESKKYQQALEEKDINSRSWEDCKPLWRKIMEEINEYEKEYFEPTRENLLPYIDWLIDHSSMTGYDKNQTIRYQSNPIHKHYLDTTVKKCWEQLQEIEKYKDDLETGGISSNRWNDFMGCVWFLTSANLYEETIWFVSVLKHTLDKVYDNNPRNCVFINVYDQPSRERWGMTLAWSLSELYKANGEIEKAKETYKYISQLRFNSSYTSLNRVLESSLYLYELEPTEKNKQHILKLHKKCFNHYLRDVTESTRERCSVMYLMLKIFYNERIDY